MMKRQNSKTGNTRRRGVLLSVLAGVCVVCVILAAVSSSFVCYAVYYDGEVVGTVSSRTALNNAIEEADTVAAEILGEAHPVVENLSVTTTLSSGADTADVLTGALLESVEGIEVHPFLTVDGQVVAAMESEEAIQAVLDGILARYTNENTVSAEFAQEVAIVSAFINVSLMTDAEGLTDLLDPENTASPYALTVVTRENVESLEALPYEEVVTYDDTAYSDEAVVTSEGVEGERLNIYVNVLENGQEVASYLSMSEILSAPVDRAVTVGTLPGSRTDSTGTYIWPTTGLITSGFGARDVTVGSSNHQGVDIGNSVGTDVFAADGGTVIFADFSTSGYGNLVKIQHDNGAVTFYAHLDEILVSVGDKVYQGQLIAQMGKTGRVTGPHLHFEIRPNGVTPVNPTKYLTGKPER